MKKPTRILFSVILFIAMTTVGLDFTGFTGCSSTESGGQGGGGGGDGGGGGGDEGGGNDGGNDNTITDAAGYEVDISDWPSYCLIDIDSPATGQIEEETEGRPDTISITLGEGILYTVDGETCTYEGSDDPWPTDWYNGICQTTISCGGYQTQYLIDGDNDQWTITTFEKYTESFNWWTFGTAGYYEGGVDACSSCLDSCSGLPGCCTGYGCICDDQC